jgi:hypothetical protein
MRAFSLMMAVCLTAGCYNYQPLTAPSPVAGTYLAVTLTDAGSQELATYLGPSVFVVRGRYMGESEQGALLVSVSSVELQRGDDVSWSGETVALPNNDIASLEVRRLAKGRSLLLAGLGAGGVVATTLAFSLVGSGSQPNPGGGRPTKQ